MRLTAGPAIRKLSRLALRDHSSPAGLVLLWGSFVVGCIPIYLGAYPDEGDKLAIGLLMTRGSVLYRDLFTHQFPFTYYWVAAALLLLGPSILAVRLSLLLLQTVAFALLMRLTRAVIPVGLAAVAWSATRHLYFSHMVLYNALDGLAVGVVFTLSLAVLVEQAGARNRVWAAIGVFSAVALLSEPLTAAPIGIGFVFLALKRERWKGIVLAGAIIGLALAGYGAYLQLSGTWPDFYRDVVLFNSQVYSKYYDLSLRSLALQAAVGLASGLNIILPGTWLGYDAYSPNANFSVLGQWLFGGFLQRAALLATSAVLLLQRKRGAALFTVLFAASLLLRTEVYLRQTAFVLVSYLASATLLARVWRLPGLKPAGRGPLSGPSPSEPLPAWLARRWVPVAALSLVVWPIVLGLVILIQHIGSYGYATNFLVYQDQAARIRAATCGRDVALGYYPADPTLYFFTGLRPVSKYVYMWPWVAEVALPDVITSLSQEEAIVEFQPVDTVWGIKTSVYLADLNNYVITHFRRVGQSYVSPQLAAKCPPAASP